MPRRSPLLPGLVAALALVPSRALPDDEPPMPTVENGRRLLTEGDELADEGKTTEAVLRYKAAFEVLLPTLRGLPFDHEVKNDVTAREDLRDVLLEEIDEDQTPEEFHANEQAMKALGLIPRDLDLKDLMVRLYTEEIAAFYDPKTETMHLIREPEAAAAEKPGLLARLLGRTGGFDKDENKTVIAHELTHALADQHYHLDALQDATRGDDDRELALAALIEGEATLAMMGAQLEDWEGEEIIALPADDLNRTMGILLPFMALAGGRSLREAPPILSETMIFPYFRGLVFCAALTNRGGWAEVDRAYAAPPLSTEQVLHPEKYRGEQADAPQAIDLGTLDAGEGWKELGRNVVGEMQTAVLLRHHRGREAAAGWDGDGFAVFDGPDGRIGLVWLSTWDSEADARQFAAAFAAYRADEGEEPDAEADSAHRDRDGAVFAVVRRGQDVAVVEGFPAEVTDRLLDAAFRATKAEKTHSPSRTEVEPSETL